MRQIKLVWILIALLSAVYGAEDSQTHSLKCNMAIVNTIDGNVLKPDPSYNELRLEINYLF